MKNSEEVKAALHQAIKEALEEYVKAGGDLKDLPWFNYKMYEEDTNADI